MNQQFKDNDVNAAVEKLKHRYLERRKKFPPTRDIPSSTSDKAAQSLSLAQRSKQSSKELKYYSKTLHELLTVVSNPPVQLRSERSLQDRSEDTAVTPLQDSQLLFTETDVTLPSCLHGSPGSQETEGDRQLHWDVPYPDTSSFVLGKVYKEMMTICEQLKAERQSQHLWEKELFERESRVKQQEEAFGRLAGLEEMIHTHIVAVEEKHQQELRQLHDILQEKTKENKRLRSSFNTMKELNNTMKRQLNEISEQNKKLECQSKRVQARLDNLQGSLSPTPHKLLSLLLNWVLDVQTFSSTDGNKDNVIDQCLPPEVLLSERFIKVLPLLADQLHHTPPSEPKLLLNLLRIIYLALRHLDNNTQRVALSATMRRIAEEVSKPSSRSAVLLSEDPESCTKTAETFRTWPLYRSPCPHTRVLSILIILCTVTQVDVLAQALNSLRTEMMCEESRGLYIQYGGVHVLLECLRTGRAGLHTPIDILMQLTEQSCHLNGFLEACSCEEFFRVASQLLKNPHLELPSLEKFSILLQKLSTIRKNHHLFELSSLHVQIKELHQKSSPSHTFLCLNLRSILHNLK